MTPSLLSFPKASEPENTCVEPGLPTVSPAAGSEFNPFATARSRDDLRAMAAGILTSSADFLIRYHDCRSLEIAARMIVEAATNYRIRAAELERGA